MLIDHKKNLFIHKKIDDHFLLKQQSHFEFYTKIKCTKKSFPIQLFFERFNEFI